MLPRILLLCTALIAAQWLGGAEPSSSPSIEQQAWDIISAEKAFPLKGQSCCIAREIEVPGLREKMNSRLYEICFPPSVGATESHSYPVCWVLSFDGRIAIVTWWSQTQEARSWIVHDGSLYYVAVSGSGAFSSRVERVSISAGKIARCSSLPYRYSWFNLTVDSDNALLVREHWTLGRVIETSPTTLGFFDRNGVEQTPERYGLRAEVAKMLATQSGGEIRECSVHETQLAGLEECMPATLYLVQQDDGSGATDKPAQTYLLEVRERKRVPGGLEVYSERKDAILDLTNYSTESRRDLLPATNAIFAHNGALYVCFRPKKNRGLEIRRFQYVDGEISVRRSGSFSASALILSTTPNGKIRVSSADSMAATAARSPAKSTRLGTLSERGDAELVIVDNRGRIVEADEPLEPSK